MDFRNKEISYLDLIPFGGIATPKKLNMIFSQYYLKYGLGIEPYAITEAGFPVYKVNGIDIPVVENNQIKYLGNQNWELVRDPSVYKSIVEGNLIFKKIHKKTVEKKGKDKID